MRAGFLVPNRRTNHLYIAGFDGGAYSGVIQVVYDSIVFAGVQEKPVVSSQVARTQTLLNRGTAMRAAAQADLYDAAGRRIAVLLPGTNDISNLPPGVYFVREEPQASGPKPQAVRKVVVTR